jgi:outer membrane lipoprotein-sorting protein
MTDRNKNLFTYTFTGTVFGKKASKEAFDFVIPKSARVVDSRKQ